MTDDLLEAALSYAARGWPVLPLKRGSKTPQTPSGFKDTTTDEKTIKEWWLYFPKANVGVCVGEESNLLVIDIDNKNGKTGSVELSKLIERLGAFETYLVHTPHGVHAYFRFPDELRGKHLKAQLADGVDLKTKGYVVAPPSMVEGMQYTVANERDISEFMAEWSADGIKQEPTALEWQSVKGNSDNGESICDRHNISMSDVLSLPSDARKTDNGYLMKHPIHGATGDGNLSISVSRNLWKCFRCDSGGDPLSWVAVREGFVECRDAAHLDKDTVMKCVDVLAKEGLIIEHVERVRDREKFTKVKDGGNNTIALTVDDYFERDANGKHKRFITKLLADAILEDNRFLTLKDTLEIYAYDDKNGVYKTGAELLIHQEVKKCLESEYISYRYNETLSYIRASTYVDRSEVETPVNLIPCANAVFNTETWEREKFRPDVPIFVKHEGGYYPELLRDRIENSEALKFIRETFPEEDVDTVQELAGACLYRAPLHKKAFMLLGDGDNGKSLFLTLLRKMLGETVTSKQSLYAIANNRFASADLYHKNANIHADLGGGDLKYINFFMQLTGGDSLTVERKHQNPFDFVSYATQVFSTNKLPDVKNPPDQFYKRWILVEMPYKFVDNPTEELERKRDPNLEAKITTPEELSIVLTWALEGLKRLLETGHFTESPSTIETKDRWITKTDSLQAFVVSQVRYVEGSRITKSEFNAAYNAWCGAHNMTPKSEAYIGRHLPKFIRTRILETKPKRSWANIEVEGVTPQVIEREHSLARPLPNAIPNASQAALDLLGLESAEDTEQDKEEEGGQ